MTSAIQSLTNSYPYPFRRRTLGRAASPPTWACYEQIPYGGDDDDDYSESLSEDESCSEDGEDYTRPIPDPDSDGEHPVSTATDRQDDTQNMEIDATGGGDAEKNSAEFKKDLKGKQRAVDPEPQPTKRRHHTKQRRPVYTLRPILTIQKSQGFVWNQDLFVPPYIKDRYVASTSPPNRDGFISNSWSSTRSSLTDYEVEVVEIRVKEGELFDIIP
ncbi:hypothetical protein SERLA73DRAFT_54061 [Serpula lacrymans var. lacrymans S7.3]|uniref:Uncharacterized protein n=2 Tax=Serpula lacrymans var. lacrymans TaxID=341189 RepID=F8PXF5_SERL3|nr:uncharacterized protein SERLADRAFT_370228 [Serpula lacrymans var. lacrymans S7.9]EGN99481.1 hypothetical protein SERLA73DRAFT_54061 [Serpula lacrymans var. lacrymans S7.3]EGO25036.1 hypothetical protein SERLADRAFT_370228 [Serpula lacrymans var. lacrymans S7.9]